MVRSLAGILGFLAVGLGAFGAHGLEGSVTPERLDTWETGAAYHLAHAVALLALSAHPEPPVWTVRCFVAGIVIFSGSLYLLVLLDLPVLGAVTPIGGVCFLAGWLSLLWTGNDPSPR